MKQQTFILGMIIRSAILTTGLVLKIVHKEFYQSFIIVGLGSIVLLSMKFLFLEYKAQKRRN